MNGNMNGLVLPMLLLAARDQPSQKLVTPILTAMIPGTSQRLIFTTISARQQTKSQEETELGLVKAAVDAGRLAQADLVNFPALDAAYKRLPKSLQSTVVFATAPAGGGRKSGGDGT